MEPYDRLMSDLICPVTGDDTWRPLCTQGPHEWVVFPSSGYIRLADMPVFEAAKEFQSPEIGEKYIAGYLKKAGSKFRRSKRRAAYLKKNLKTGSRVLDVGSNVGFFVRAANALGLQAEGLEINSVLTAHARETNPGMTFHDCALEEFELNGAFDGIYCSEVIEHVTDVTGFAEGILGLLKPGGALYLTTPSADEYMKGGSVIRDLGAPDHKLYFNKKNIGPFLQRVGFSSVSHKLAFGGGLQVIARR